LDANGLSHVLWQATMSFCAVISIGHCSAATSKNKHTEIIEHLHLEFPVVMRITASLALSFTEKKFDRALR
jgi:hypothetical protein